MNGQTLVDRVREGKRTELDRLASDKALIAATEATLEPAAVLGTVAATERGLETLYDDWAEETLNQEAAETLAAAADGAGENADRLDAERDEERDVAALTTATEFEDTIEAVAGGLVGQSLVLDGVLLQSINFFVNEADERRADVLRDVRTTNNGRINDGSVLLNSLCTSDEEWSRAETTAKDLVEASYGEYVERLGEMGIDPKPVC